MTRVAQKVGPANMLPTSTKCNSTDTSYVGLHTDTDTKATK